MARSRWPLLGLSGGGFLAFAGARAGWPLIVAILGIVVVVAVLMGWIVRKFLSQADHLPEIPGLLSWRRRDDQE